MNWNEQREVLKSMGYSSYKDYIAGVVWANIREKVFKEKGEGCTICSRRANTIHHRIYTEEVLRGTDIRTLEPLCWDCHQRVEYDKWGDKSTLYQANLKLDWYRDNKDVWQKRKWSSVCLDVRKGTRRY
jgi:5-methylcytosine-specific restriction endonuclease McrA